MLNCRMDFWIFTSKYQFGNLMMSQFDDVALEVPNYQITKLSNLAQLLHQRPKLFRHFSCYLMMVSMLIIKNKFVRM